MMRLRRHRQPSLVIVQLATDKFSGVQARWWGVAVRAVVEVIDLATRRAAEALRIDDAPVRSPPGCLPT
jgi:hypothetical protein